MRAIQSASCSRRGGPGPRRSSPAKRRRASTSLASSQAPRGARRRCQRARRVVVRRELVLVAAHQVAVAQRGGCRGPARRWPASVARPRRSSRSSCPKSLGSSQSSRRSRAAVVLVGLLWLSVEEAEAQRGPQLAREASPLGRAAPPAWRGRSRPSTPAGARGQAQRPRLERRRWWCWSSLPGAASAGACSRWRTLHQGRTAGARRAGRGRGRQSCPATLPIPRAPGRNARVKPADARSVRRGAGRARSYLTR